MENRIRHFRKLRDLTLAELAGKIGTTPQSISRLETGHMTLSTEWLKKLADAFHVHPTDLLDPPSRRTMPLLGLVDEDGRLDARAAGRLVFENVAADPVAVRLAAPQGRYDAGDMLIGDRLGADDRALAVDRDCLAAPEGGAVLLCRLIRPQAEYRFILSPLAGGPSLVADTLSLAAPIVMRVSYF